MTEQDPRATRTQHQYWRRFLDIRAASWGEEDSERMVELFSIVMIVSAVVSLALATAMLMAGFRRLFSSILYGFLAAGIAGSYAPVSLIARYFARRGHLRTAARWYIWAMFFGVIAVALLFSGYQSVGWMILLWPVALAGMVLAPINALYMVGISLFAYFVVYVAQVSFGYVPPFAQSTNNFRFLALNFIFNFLASVSGILMYLSSTNTRLALEDMAEREAEFRASQAELTQRVDERTVALANRARQLQVIADVIRSSSIAQDPEMLFRSVVNTIAERMAFYHVGVFLNDAANEWTELKAASSEGGQNMLSRGHRLRVGQQGMVGYTSGTGIPRYASSVGEDAVWFNNPDLPETQSEIALPLTMEGRLFGVLDIQVTELSAFDNEDVQVLQILADGISSSYRNTLLLTESRRAVERYEQLQQQDTVRAWRQALTRQNLSLGYAWESGNVQPVGNRDEKDASLALPAGVTTDVGENGMYRLMAPITVSGQNVGVLTFQRIKPWTDDTVRLAESVIAQLDLALTNARLLDETRLRASQETARGEIVSRVRAMTSTDAILRNAAEELGRALNVERSRIQLMRYDQ